MCIYTYLNIHIHIHTHTYIYIHTHIITYIHIFEALKNNIITKSSQFYCSVL